MPFITHHPLLLRPDAMRTVIRPFAPEDPSAFAVKDHPRIQRIVERILRLDDQAVTQSLATALETFDHRHRDVEALFQRRFDELTEIELDRATVSPDRALLIGAYFSQEFSFESAALFNPSAVRHPDQSGLNEGDTRFIISLRGIGEGHVSSLTFRSGVWAADGTVTVDPASEYAVPPIIDREEDMDGGRSVHLNCGGSREISETVIFPFLPSQGKGIEDVRLVEFTEEDGTTDYRGTFTAFNGLDVRQVLLRSPDLRTFDMHTIQGPLADSKGAALFPRRIDGRHFMLARQDAENIWLFETNDTRRWSEGRKIVTPVHAWEFVQLGNCGSPIEIDEGWLVLTHGVGVARNYCVGACLLDKADPYKVLKRLPVPLLAPSANERDGYVPNVVYSCGALLRGRQLMLPYGVADSFTAFATVDVDLLLAAMA